MVVDSRSFSIRLPFIILGSLFLSALLLFEAPTTVQMPWTLSFVGFAVNVPLQDENDVQQSLRFERMPTTLPDGRSRHNKKRDFHRSGENDNAPGNFLVPLLTNHVGDNNQLIEYMTAAVVSRATNRTLCLTPFFKGPSKHGGRLPRMQKKGLAVEERYDVESLSKFVKVASEDECLAACGKKFESFWWLRPTYPPHIQEWRWDLNVTNHNQSWDFVRWTSTKDIYGAFRPLLTEQCVALGGLFPGLRWRGAYLATSLVLRPADAISAAATALQAKAIGMGRPFLAVHWRFHESICPDNNIGLCFLRCKDGSVIDSGLHSTALEWKERESFCTRDRVHTRGVLLLSKDLIDAIREKATAYNLSVVYLATDGWMRGTTGQSLVKKVVTTLRRSGLFVVGLWNIKRLPNFSDGRYFKVSFLNPFLREVTGHSVSQIEQEICSRAYAFLGSGESTWSLIVFLSRLARRRHRQIEASLSEKQELSNEGLDNHVIESLLTDNHASGLQCQYQAFYRRARVNATAETYEEEAPDGWLDFEACEGRIGKGGSCKIAACF